MMIADKDTLFANKQGEINHGLARLCYMITSVGGKTNLTSTDVKFIIQNKLSSADFFILKNKATELTDYGLRAGGKTGCPKCQSRNAAYMALVDDRFFRPTLGNLRSWKADRSSQIGSESANGNNTSGR
jgi:hypothetical protein